MARPKKDKALLMNRSIRLMLTADQDDLIRQAAELQGIDKTAWARPILLDAARRIVEEPSRASTGKVRREKETK